MRRWPLLLPIVVFVGLEVAWLPVPMTDLLPRSWLPQFIIDSGYAVHSVPGTETKDWSAVTHPALDYQLDQRSQEQPWLGLVRKFLEVTWLVGGIWLIRRLWKNFRLGSHTIARS